MVGSVFNKVLLSLASVCFLLSMTALPLIFTNAVPAAVEENFATFPLDTICGSDGDCDDIENDWAISTTTRDYYAWDLDNLDDVVNNNAEPRYVKKGPYTYTITSEKTLLNHDTDNGELTYNVVKSYECSQNSENSCDEELTQLNIQFRPQQIGATGTAINGIMELTKVGFASGMIAQDLNTTQAGIATSQFITSMAETIGGAGFGSYSYTALTAAEAAGQVEVILPNTLDGNILPLANFIGGIDDALYDSVHPLDKDFDISLTEQLGPVAFMSMGEPEELLSIVESNPDESIVMKRANAYGYVANEMVDLDEDGIAESEIIDYAQTYIRDWSLYVGIGLEFQSNGGGSQYTDSEDIANRLNNLLDVDFSDVDCLKLMSDGDGTDTPTGLLAQNAGGTSFGLSKFLTLSPSEAESLFGLNYQQYDSILQWSTNWAMSTSSLQLALLGGTGKITAKEFVNQTFGSNDPVSGDYLLYSLNQGGNWALQNSVSPVNLSAEKSAEILYGAKGLTTTDASLDFLYGQLSGKSVPSYLGTNGEVKDWNLEIISEAYNISITEAQALQDFVYDQMFSNFVEGFLIDGFGAKPYLTQSVNSWLLGWHDPVSAYLASGDSSNMSVGWASLESNKTFFGSNGVANGDGTNYTICTGERTVCEKGENLKEDGSEQMSWRNDRMYEATKGLITQEKISGTTGGFISGNDDKVDVSGYAIADITCSGEDIVKKIPVYSCSASVDPTQRPIQANLLKTFSILDATPSALPIYLGSEISIKSEQLSGLIIAGESTTKFYIDTRDDSQMYLSPNIDDLTPVFEIRSKSTIEDSDAETMHSGIVQNQNFFTYWTNFDNPLDFLPFMVWLIFFGCIIGVLCKTYRDLGIDDYDSEVLVVEIGPDTKGGGLLEKGLLLRDKN